MIGDCNLMSSLRSGPSGNKKISDEGQAFLDNSVNDISIGELEHTRASFGTPGQSISVGDRFSLPPRWSDAKAPDRRVIHKNIFGNMGTHMGVSNTEIDEDEEDHDSLGLIPTNLDGLEKTEERRRTFIKMPKGAFREGLKTMTKINTKDITSMVKSRFMGQSEELSLTEKRSDDFKNKGSESVENKRSIIDFVQKFGFVEMREIDHLLAASGSRRSTIEIGLDRVERSFSIKAGTENEDEIYDPSELMHEPFTFMEDKLIDEKMYLEDVTDTSLFDVEILNNLNAELDGQYQATLCSYAICEGNPSLSIFGTESGEIIEITLADRTIIKKHSLESKITALGLSPDGSYFGAGSANSELMFKKTEGKMAKKYIKNLNQQKINAIRFTENNAALVGSMFNVYYFVISSYSLLLEVTMTTVMPRQPSLVMQLASHFQGGILRVVVALNDKIALFGLTRDEGKKEAQVYKVGSEIEEEVFNSNSANNKWPPVVDWVIPQNESDPIRVVIFWKQKLWFIDFLSNNWVLKTPRDLTTKVVWAKVLNNRVICMINPNLEIEFLSIDRVFAEAIIKSEGFARLPLDEGILKDQRDVQYMTKYKDKLEDETVDLAMKIPFFQFFRNRIKEIGDDIYLITDKGLLKYRLVTFDRLIDSYIVKGQLVAALKMINNIFLERAHCSLEEKDSVRELVPVAVRNYVDKKLALDTDMMTEAQIQLLDLAIEILIYSGNVESIFESIQPKFAGKLFWGEVAKFIRQKLLKNIPYEYLVSGYNYLDNEDIIQILRDFKIEDQDDDEQAINKVLMVIKKKNIWPYLYKFCVFYPTRTIQLFLTMLVAEIMMDPNFKDSIDQDAIWDNPQLMDLDTYFDDENKRLFFRVFWFFNLVLAPGSLESSLSHFSSQPEALMVNIPEIYSKTLEWILDGNNAKVVIETHSKMFFETVYQCVNNQQMLKCQKVIDLIRKIKNIHLKKTDQTNDLKFVASFRATQSLNHEPYPFVVAENILMIFDEVLEEKYKQDLAFVATRVLNFGTHERRFENQEWICVTLSNAMREPFKANRFWVDYKPTTQDKFEDLIIGACDKLEDSKFLGPPKKTITALAMDNRYTRVYVHMVGSDIKLIETFRLFLKNTTENNCQYLFEWIKKNIADPNVDKAELTEELTKWMDRLVSERDLGRVGQGPGQRHRPQTSEPGTQSSRISGVAIVDT